jgi:hypothetical protein
MEYDNMKNMIKGDKTKTKLTFLLFHHIFLCMLHALVPSIMTLNSEHDKMATCVVTSLL